jgi:hypothetical protein
MTPLEYALGLISILMSLALADILMSLHRLMRHAGTIKWSHTRRDAARGRPGDPVEEVVRANVSRACERLRTAAEPILLDPQRQGRLRLSEPTTL